MSTDVGADPTLGYDPQGAWDEAFAGRGEPRPEHAPVLRSLAGRDLAELRGDVDAHLETRGCRFMVPGGSEAFVVDPVPRVLGTDEWARLAAGLEQRVRALEAFVADVYGDRRAIAAGVVPAHVIETAEHLEPGVADHHRPVHVAVAGLDVVRGADGALRVLEDNLRTPSGLAYAIAAAEAVRPHFGAGGELRDLAAEAVVALRRALRGALPEGGGHALLLSSGPASAAWWEHTELARRLGIAVATPEDCSVRRGRLVVRDAGGRARQVAVVLRRTDEDRLRDLAGALTPLGELLEPPLRAGTLACLNAFGTGVADDKLVHPHVEDLVRFFCGEEPLLESVPSHDLTDPQRREEALARLDELVVKPRSGAGGKGVVIGADATHEELAGLARAVRERPHAYVAQETVLLSRHPTVVDGRLVPRHIDLRPFVINDGERVVALPGGLTRVAFGEGALVVNSSRDGGGKDTWVLR